MELNSVNFPSYLGEVLHDLSCSCFVSIDLEFSGIPLAPGSQSTGEQSLEERYADNKVAAEKYQVLQLGLTMCRENVIDATYTLKPYNIDLSPFVDRMLDVNRDWVSMSWAMEFLVNNSFSIDNACKNGVRYLSRQEEAQALELAEQRYSLEGSKRSIEVKETDKESLEFLNSVRGQINRWLSQPKKQSKDYLNIPSLSGFRSQGRTLTSMERRFVHQLVTAEYPSLKSKSKSNFVQIEFADPERDKRNQIKKLNVLKQTIRKHVGCRWIIEALMGGDLTGIEEQSFKHLMGKPDDISYTMAELVSRVKCRLKKNRPILVGHNCFLDLMFLYRSFIGPLPDTFGEFQTLIHAAFPMVIDTKYLATHDAGSINPKSSLEDINRGLANVTVPTINIDPSHSKYFFRQTCHEAGYDSMMAAFAFIKLSSQLQRGKVEFSSTAKTDDITFTMAKEMPLAKQVAEQMEKDRIAAEDDSDDLIELSDSGSGQSGQGPPRPPPLTETECPDVTSKVSQGQLIPRLGSEFWQIYGNKLRVFGTVERAVWLAGAMP
ncbi:uncharacterized protein N7483_011942 [Penicillium malachiteum]|uniref:uncharacterized protein n=1 Tax=Penicillium malachiteum TaxID=1324776 RepID=UPI00254736E6|nr:uncharacterized protein N7483_011942 [Penicillium malachiteum]KAJ5714761.1 hypothetical protein N7483_011942 [Penicillium malachiteum]